MLINILWTYFDKVNLFVDVKKAKAYYKGSFLNDK
jgi:hypothetical protein